MQSLWNDGESHGYKNKVDVNGQPACCDDDKSVTTDTKAAISSGKMNQYNDKNNWGLCVLEERWDEWFWMQNLDMTSKTHQFIAKDMQRVIEEHFAP